VLAVFAFIAVYPITQIITISLRPSDRLLSTSLALIPEGDARKLPDAPVDETPFLRWMANSLLVAGW
jgi:arabinogalactan oligomer / maltooligosaccharide transport system permease protein